MSNELLSHLRSGFGRASFALAWKPSVVKFRALARGRATCYLSPHVYTSAPLDLGERRLPEVGCSIAHTRPSASVQLGMTEGMSERSLRRFAWLAPQNSGGGAS
jgi:hypothetical protein